ncbi:BTAD domain-containing putative transcriptional regulator [Amycolatopsis sp. NPDC049868]|uniref:BTAD domain-containing putative transcriptional regulator n=1 Tax=Amycolatopsis sp. NPDC049868 TaxID=3363934 RepID=UPI0037ADDF85
MTADRLRVEALGSLRAWRGDNELDLGPARQRAVFAALATRATTQPMTMAELIQAVWGATAPASASGSVHTYISGLRQILDPSRTRWSTGGLLVSDASGYLLRLDNDALDVHEFEQLCDTARSCRQDGNVGGGVETLDRALALWSGEALSGVPGPYAESLRTRLAERRILALEMRAAYLLELGSHEDLVPDLTVLVRKHPLRESLWQSLMITLHREGRTTEALDAFRNAREVLRNELGITPGPALVEVHRQILTNDPALIPAPADERPSDKLLSVLPDHVAHTIEDRRTSLHLCRGREKEIAELRQLVDDVLKGHGRTTWIEGEPGIGKSDLLMAALADIGERGCHVAWTAPSEPGQQFPLQTIMDCLGMDAGEATARRALEDVDPVTSTADRVLAYVDRLCATAPLVMIIDDLHWADEASVLVWNRISVAARQLPLLLIAASRPVPRWEELAKARRAAESRGLEVITLAPLADSDAEDLIGDLVGARPGEELRSLVPKAAGNPLYLREVIGALAREQSIEVTDGIANVRNGTAAKAPESLIGAVVRTLDLADELTRETLRRAAVLGAEFGLAQIAATMDKMPSDLLGVFEHVMETRIIVDTETHLAFRHPMLRWTLYNEIPKNVRASWHRRAAEALAETGSGVEQVARQLVAVPAAVDDWVISWLTENHESLSNRAPSIAAMLLHQVSDECPSDDPRREVLLAAYVLVLCLLDQEPLELAKEAMLISRDPDRAAEMRHLAAMILLRRGDTGQAIDLLEGNDSPETPLIWRERRRSLLADFNRGDIGRTRQKTPHPHHDALADEEPHQGDRTRPLLRVATDRPRHRRARMSYGRRRIRFRSARPPPLRSAAGSGVDRAPHRSASGHKIPAATWTGPDTVSEERRVVTFHGLREPGPAALMHGGVSKPVCGRGRDPEAAQYLRAPGTERERCSVLHRAFGRTTIPRTCLAVDLIFASGHGQAGSH